MSTKPKHTPGPWIKTLGTDENHFDIQQCHKTFKAHGTNVLRNVRREADATLIAAAPDMLEALKAAFNLTKHALEQDQEKPFNPQDVLAVLGLAIAKAEGRAA